MVYCLIMMGIGPCARSDWPETHALSEYKHTERVFYCFTCVKSISWSKWRSLRCILHCDKTLRTYGNTHISAIQKDLLLVFFVAPNYFHISAFINVRRLKRLPYRSLLWNYKALLYGALLWRWPRGRGRRRWPSTRCSTLLKFELKLAIFFS